MNPSTIGRIITWLVCMVCLICAIRAKKLSHVGFFLMLSFVIAAVLGHFFP